MEFVQISYRRS
uniref:Kynurenine alpha-aminoadipate mitochondrial-like protein n=1 Tax=Triatoma infestans TaxID=30076 RepID=A0A170ZRX3_TRIIF